MGCYFWNTIVEGKNIILYLWKEMSFPGLMVFYDAVTGVAAGQIRMVKEMIAVFDIVFLLPM